MVKLLLINPGSTSTKIAVYENDKMVFNKTIRHDIEEIVTFKTSYLQREYREKHILEFLNEANYQLVDFDYFIGRGGLLKPLVSGTYLVDEKMYEDLKNLTYGDHPCNLGGIIALDFANKVGKQAYIVDPVVVDELNPYARVSGYQGIERRSAFHALNQKAIGKRFAEEHHKNYQDLTLIIVHLGGGISIGLHQKGKVIDVNDAAGGDGAFSPDRAGALPIFPLIDEAMKHKDDIVAFKKFLITKAGLYSYLKSNSVMEIESRIKKGDQKAIFYVNAMAYNINKHIGALYFAAKGNVDALIITGGIANNKYFTKVLKSFLPDNIPYYIYPGEDELSALASGALKVIKGEEKLKIY